MESWLIAQQAWLIAQQAQLLAIRCALEGMIAENDNRKYRNQSPAYDEAQFVDLQTQAERISNLISQSR